MDRPSIQGGGGHQGTGGEAGVTLRPSPVETRVLTTGRRRGISEASLDHTAGLNWATFCPIGGGIATCFPGDWDPLEMPGNVAVLMRVA